MDEICQMWMEEGVGIQCCYMFFLGGGVVNERVGDMCLSSPFLDFPEDD